MPIKGGLNEEKCRPQEDPEEAACNIGRGSELEGYIHGLNHGLAQQVYWVLLAIRRV